MPLIRLMCMPGGRAVVVNLSATYFNLTFGRANVNVVADHEGVTG